MASIKDLKKRIGTVKNTQQTTKAMKMVSAAKLRRAQEAINNQRPYAKRVGDLIKLATSLSDQPVHSPLIHRERVEGAPANALVVVVTSDRGLCGGFNANVIKRTQRWVRESEGQYGKVTLAFVGRKGYDFFKTRKYNLGPNWTELGGKVTFHKAKRLADHILAAYLSGEFDEVKFVYNEFKNAVTQRVMVDDFLPLQPGEGGVAQVEPGKAAAVEEVRSYIVKPSPAEVVHSLLAKNFAIQAFRILLESQAGEHGARMSAMENATKNAGDMIRKLTLQYNKQRQAGITKELLEIIAGSESQKG